MLTECQEIAGVEILLGVRHNGQRKANGFLGNRVETECTRVVRWSDGQEVGVLFLGGNGVFVAFLQN